MLRKPVAFAACVARGSSIERGTEPSAAWCSTICTRSHAFDAGLPVGDVAFDERVAPPVRLADGAPHVVEIAAMPGREIVEADDFLPGREQRLHEMRADEAGAAGHQPAPRPRSERRARLLERDCARCCPASEPPDVDAALAQRRRVRLALHVGVDAAGLRASPAKSDTGRARNSRCATAATIAFATGSASQDMSSTPYSCRASAGIGDRIVHVDGRAVRLAARARRRSRASCAGRGSSP